MTINDLIAELQGMVAVIGGDSEVRIKVIRQVSDSALAEEFWCPETVSCGAVAGESVATILASHQ